MTQCPSAPLLLDAQRVSKRTMLNTETTIENNHKEGAHSGCGENHNTYWWKRHLTGRRTVQVRSDLHMFYLQVSVLPL